MIAVVVNNYFWGMKHRTAAIGIILGYSKDWWRNVSKRMTRCLEGKVVNRYSSQTAETNIHLSGPDAVLALKDTLVHLALSPLTIHLI